jgi:hypothetical protein
MSEELFNADRFHIYFPMWAILDVEAYQRQDWQAAFTVPAFADGEKFAPLFTDLDLAKRFIEELPLPGRTPMEATAETLPIFLEVWERAEVTRVGIDMSLIPIPRARFIPLREIREALESDPGA